MRRAYLRNVVAWKPPGGALAGAPEVRFLPPLVRRRCDDLTRAMLHVAEACAPPEALASSACVFASRRASLTAMVELLSALADGKPLSPNTFSHSVHNAPAGVFSVWAQNRNACSSVAAGRETFVSALLEALGLLARDPGRDVLLVCGDEAPPPPLPRGAGETVATHAVALWLGARGDGNALTLSLEASTAAAAPRASDALAFAEWWGGAAPALSLSHGKRRWTLTRG